MLAGPRRCAGRAAGTAVALVLALLAAACAPLPSATQAPAVASRPPRTTDWSGRFSLTVTEPGIDERTESTQGRFTIHRDDDDALDVSFASPFGQTLGRLRVAPSGGAALTLSDGRRLDGATADALVADLLGWTLPVGRLVHWLEDRPRAGDDGGWRVDVERRFEDGRPRLLRALWPAAQRADQRRLGLRVFVDSVAP